MCGIAGFITNKTGKVPEQLFYNRAKTLITELGKMGARSNNYDATGFYHTGMGIVKGNIPSYDFVQKDEFTQMERVKSPRIFMAHCRYATVGDEDINDNNAPQWSDNYILVHNGGIESDENLKKSFKGEVDSLHILACLEKYGEEEFIKHIRGVAAFVIAKRDNPDEIIFYRDTRPLYIMKDIFGIWLASTREVLKEIDSISAVKERKGFKKYFYYPEIADVPSGKVFKITMSKEKFEIVVLAEYVLPSLKTKTTAVAAAQSGIQPLTTSYPPIGHYYGDDEFGYGRTGYSYHSYHDLARTPERLFVKVCNKCKSIIKEFNSVTVPENDICDICRESVPIYKYYKFDVFVDKTALFGAESLFTNEVVNSLNKGIVCVYKNYTIAAFPASKNVCFYRNDIKYDTLNGKILLRTWDKIDEVKELRFPKANKFEILNKNFIKVHYNGIIKASVKYYGDVPLREIIKKLENDFTEFKAVQKIDSKFDDIIEIPLIKNIDNDNVTENAF